MTHIGSRRPVAALRPALQVVVVAMAWPWVAAHLLNSLDEAGVDRFTALGAVFSVTALVGAIGWIVRRRTPALQLPPTPLRQWVLIMAAATLAFLLAAATQFVETGPGIGGLEAGERTAAAVLAALAGATLVPVTEELIYRGVLYQAWRHRLVGANPRWPEGATRLRMLLPALTGSSVLFGLSHYEVATIAGMGTLALFGFVMAIAYEFTGRLWVPILVHSTYNLIRGLSDLDLPTYTGSVAVLAMVIVAGGLGMATGPPAPRGFVGSGRDLHPFGRAGRTSSLEGDR